MTMRVVLDTNTLVSALLFRHGRLSWLRHAWQVGDVTPVLCRATMDELLRVMTYPKFGLERAAIDELLADLLPYAEVVTLEAARAAGPICRDPEDQVFIELLIAAGADALVTGVRDLLALAGATDRPILNGAELRDAIG